MPLEIPKQYKSLQYESEITWAEIFAVWRASEAYQEVWQKHWTTRGFDSWEAWRKNYAAPLEPEKLRWAVYEISEPKKDMLQMYGVPSRSWQKKCYGGEVTKKISDILDHPMVMDNRKVKEIRENFPHETMLVGIIHEGKIVLIEGMHRACALAQMDHASGNVVIALAEFENELPVIGKGDDFK